MSMDDIFKLPKGDNDLTDLSGKKKVKKGKGISAKKVTGGVAFEFESGKKSKGKSKSIDTPYGSFKI